MIFLEKRLERNCILNSFDTNFCLRWQEFLATTAKDKSKTIITKHNPKTFHNMRYYFPLSSALLSAVALLSPTTESFAPRSLTSAKPSQTSLSVSVSESLDGTLPQNTSVASVPKVAQRWRKSTKQLATLGPASSNYEMIEKVWTAEIDFFGNHWRANFGRPHSHWLFGFFLQLFLAGADCFRLNFSHGSQEQKKELLMTIREIEEKYSHPIGILGDLQGPKLRVSLIDGASQRFLFAPMYAFLIWISFGLGFCRWIFTAKIRLENFPTQTVKFLRLEIHFGSISTQLLETTNVWICHIRKSLVRAR